MLKRSHKLIAGLLLAASTAAMVGCDAKSLTQAINNAANSEAGKALIHQAAVALKSMDEGGVELAYTEDNILSVTVGGKEVKPTYDEHGNMLLELPPGQEHDVVVGLKDGQQVSVPIRPEAGDFKDGKRPEFKAFVMPGGENQLFGEVVRPGMEVRDVFKGKAVRVDIDRAELTNETLRQLYIGRIKAPRHTYFVENGDLMLHPSNLWVIAEARGIHVGAQQGGQMPPPPGGQQPGGQMPPPPGGAQPGGQMPPPPGFNLLDSHPMAPQQPAPGGQQPPMMDKPFVFRLVAELAPGKFTVYKLEASRVPGPPLLPKPGEKPVFVAQNPPSIDKGVLKVTTEEVADVAAFERESVQVETGHKFMPPPPPSGPRPGGQQPPPQR